MSHLLLIIIFESVCITKRLVMNVSMATSLCMHVHQLPSVVVYTLCLLQLDCTCRCLYYIERKRLNN